MLHSLQFKWTVARATSGWHNRWWNSSWQLRVVAKHHKTSNNSDFNHFQPIGLHFCWYLSHGRFDFPSPSHTYKITVCVSFVYLLSWTNAHHFPNPARGMWCPTSYWRLCACNCSLRRLTGHVARQLLASRGASGVVLDGIVIVIVLWNAIVVAPSEPIARRRNTSSCRLENFAH